MVEAIAVLVIAGGFGLVSSIQRRARKIAKESDAGK